MTLTMTEKQHWMERIDTRFRTEIEKIKEKDREFFESVNAEVRPAAIESLGITENKAKIDALEAKYHKVRNELWILRDMTANKLLGGAEKGSYGSDQIIEGAIKRAIPAVKERLLAKHSLGKQVLEIEKEKGALLDAMWLSTSLRQIREVWQQVDKLLGASPSEFQTKLFSRKK